jgi:glycosyltransferase involved in cell wall biosynthesis
MESKKTYTKTNILFVLIQLAVGGSERVVLELTKHLDRSLFNVFVAFFSDGALRKSFNEACQEIFHIPKKKRFDLNAMLQISRIIRDRHIDVINAHHYMPFVYSYLGSKVMNKKRLIYTEHSVPEVEAMLASKHKHFCNLMLRKTDAVVGVSSEIEESLRKAFPIHTRKIKSIINGLDVDRFNAPINRNKVRLGWGILPEHFVIGNVANFRKVKNHACLIRAFGRLNAIYPNTRLVLVGRSYTGDGENSEEEVRHLIDGCNLQGRVILTGYQEDIPRILHMFDVFCLPSFSEGLPVSILEAMSSGVPVVGSDVGGIREVISDGKTGLLFPSNDDNTLAQTMEHLILRPDLRESISKNAFSYVSQNHGLKQWILIYQHLFQSAQL